MKNIAVKGWLLGWTLAAGVGAAFGDEMVLANGQSVRGVFVGFQDHRFVLKTSEGKDYAEFAANIQAINMDAPPFVSAQFLTKRFDNVQFKGYSQFSVRLIRGGDEITEPVTMLKSMEIFRRAQPGKSTSWERPKAAEPPPPGWPPATKMANREVRQDSDSGGNTTGERDWQRSGRWREAPVSGAHVISHGEEVDIAQSLDKGVVNVVHFNLPSVLSSVRQGSYLATLATKSKSRFVVQRIEISDWSAPICTAWELKSLPQFWFYSRRGRLIRKLTNRFTESDIDAALKEAMQAD